MAYTIFSGLRSHGRAHRKQSIMVSRRELSKERTVGGGLAFDAAGGTNSTGVRCYQTDELCFRPCSRFGNELPTTDVNQAQSYKEILSQDKATTTADYWCTIERTVISLLAPVSGGNYQQRPVETTHHHFYNINIIQI
eukprot:scaffold39080_cov148-Skeletonema_marinoi.AAC.8